MEDYLENEDEEENLEIRADGVNPELAEFIAQKNQEKLAPVPQIIFSTFRQDPGEQQANNDQPLTTAPAQPQAIFNIVNQTNHHQPPASAVHHPPILFDTT